MESRLPAMAIFSSSCSCPLYRRQSQLLVFAVCRGAFQCECWPRLSSLIFLSQVAYQPPNLNQPLSTPIPDIAVAPAASVQINAFQNIPLANRYSCNISLSP